MRLPAPLLLPTTLLLALLLALVPSGCEPGTKFVEEAPFTIEDIDTRVADQSGVRRAYLDIELTGAHNGSEGSLFLVDLDIVIKAQAPDGRPLELPDGGRVNFRHTEPGRMHRVMVPVYFDLPTDAPRGAYQVSIEVVDKLAEQSRSSTLVVEL